MRRIVIYAIFIISSVSMYGQQDAQFTQYMYNTLNVNPGYAGSRGVTSLFASHRQQWVGFTGAPTTSAFTIHTPLPKNVGAGVSVQRDMIGAQGETIVNLDFSYTVYLSETTKLSFGLKGSLNQLDVDFSKLNAKDPTDVRYQTNIDNRFSPNIGAGVYLHGKKAYLGLSVPQLIETAHFDSSASAGSYISSERLHYYIIGGYVFTLSDNLKFKPTVLNKIVLGAPMQLDVSGNFLINEKFTAGLAYRLSGAVSILAGFQVNQQLFIGYSYDSEMTAIRSYNGDSHEIFIRYELFKDYGRVVSPRFF